MSGDDLTVVPALAMLSCGVSAVALDPRNNASRLMLSAGVCGAAAYLLLPFAGQHLQASTTSVLLRWLATTIFLVFSASLAGLLVVFPSGRLALPWDGRVVIAFFALAVAGPLLQVLGSSRLSADGDPGTFVDNDLASPRLRALGPIGGLLVDSEPLWVVLGLVFFLWRYRRADAAVRRALRPLLASVAGLALLLLAIIVTGVAGIARPQPGFQYLFLAVLTTVPVTLLVGLSERSRTLNRELSASRSRLLSAEDDARRRLERDLHDGVQQQLVALLSLAELAARQARAQSPAVQGTLGDVRGQLTDAIDELRELVNGIRPPVLTDSGVAAALESRMRRLPAEITLDLAGARARRWPAETEAAAYFVACEAVTNALKHAPGASVRVRLLDDAGDLRVEVADEGPGLPADVAGGTGLLGLRDRVDSIGGALTVLPGPLGGTVVSAVFNP